MRRNGTREVVGRIHAVRITSREKRTFKPNIQKVRALIDGKVCRIRVSAKAIKMGLVVKPMKRDYKPVEA